LPVYVQPVCPAPGYIWTPGYWAYGPEGYFWVPGTWILAPTPGLLWTPGYWGYAPGGYFWHGGYWGPHVGFYGGINYGFGYTGVGFVGGYWSGGQYYYNRSVTAVNVTVVHNTYNNVVVNNNTAVNRVSYNGGTGGITAQPTAAETAAARERHVQPTAAQAQHYQAASSNPELRASANNGQPRVAATARPGVFTGPGVIAAHRENVAATSANAAGTKPGAQSNAQVSQKTNTAAGPAGANTNSKTTANTDVHPTAGGANHPQKAEGGGHPQQHPAKPQEQRERGGEHPEKKPR
jgi:WXXGXW repeat (2 copies)